MKIRRLFLLLFFALPHFADAQPTPLRSAWGIPWMRIPAVVVVSRSADADVQLVRDAVEHWNRVLAEAGSAFRLGPVVHHAGDVPVPLLAALSERVLSRSGIDEMPAEVRALPGELIVALSDGDFVSFAARWPHEAHAIVAIRKRSSWPLSLPNVARNVIAHELGHAIGLGHNDDPAMLMCGRPAPCRPDAFASRNARFFPLQPGEITKLLEMYPGEWQPR